MPEQPDKSHEIIKTENQYDFEREASREELDRILNEFFQKHTKNYHSKTIDRLGRVAVCHFTSKPDGRYFFGSGKGNNSLIGSQCEAIEHYVQQIVDVEECESMSLCDIKNQKHFENDQLLQYIAKEFPDYEISVKEFRDTDSLESIFVPSLYVNPDIISDVSSEEECPENYLLRYSSNNGFAFGATDYEANLHALNEAIERHYESALYSHIVMGSNFSSWVKLYTNLPQSSLTNSDDNLGFERIVLSVSPTVSGGFASFAFVQTKGDRFSRKLSRVGGGCSISRDLAIQRSLDELQQSLSLDKWREFNEDESADIEEKDGYNLLMNNGVLSRLVDFAQYSTCVEASVSSLPRVEVDRQSPKDQFESQVSKLNRNGFRVLQRKIAFDSAASIRQIFVPRFDRFFLVRSGKRVAPFLT